MKHSYIFFQLVFFAASLIVAGPVNAGSKPKLNGLWQLNRELSSDGRSELPRTLDQSDLIQTIDVAEAWSMLESDPDATEMLEATELLEVFWNGSEITINAIGGENVVLTRTVYSDRRESKQRFGFLSGISQAHWEGSALYIETSSATQRVSEKFELSSDASLLFTTITIERNDWLKPLIIKRVYDRVS